MVLIYHVLLGRSYIKKLIKHEMKQADEDIDHITTKLQNNINEKQKQVGNKSRR